MSPLKTCIQGISLAKTGLYYKLRYVIGGDHQTLLLLDVDDFFALLMILRIYIVLIFGSPLLLPCPVGQSYSIYNIKLTKWLDVYCLYYIQLHLAIAFTESIFVGKQQFEIYLFVLLLKYDIRCNYIPDLVLI